MSEVPKERQSAYHRWEVASLDAERAVVSAETSARHTAISMQHLAQIAEMKEQARLEGYAAGLALGQQEGYDSAKADVISAAGVLHELAVNFSAALAALDQAAAQAILDLALDMAKAMLHQALQIKPELVLAVICSAMRTLPFVQTATLAVHPEDAQLVRSALPEALGSGWILVEDAQMTRGECRIDTPTNCVDASLSGRWKRLAEALGQPPEWIA
jgi:flagellar assembly protein FliH